MTTIFSILRKVFLRLYAAFEKWQKDDAAELAAATSYYVALSFFQDFSLSLLADE